MSNDPTLAVKPTKVVAGHEPEQTNRLLQRIAFIISNKVNTTPVTNGETKKSESKKNDSPMKPRRPSDPKAKLTRTASKDTAEIKKTKSRTSSKEDLQKISKDKKPRKIEKQKTIIKDLEEDPINTLDSGNVVHQESLPVLQEIEEKRKKSGETFRKDPSLEPQDNQGKRKNSKESVQKEPSEPQTNQEKRRKSVDRKSSSGSSRKSSAEKKPTPEERKPSGRKQSVIDRKNSIPEEPIVKNDVNEVDKPKKDIIAKAPSMEEKIENENGNPLKAPQRKTEDIQAPPPLTRQNSILSRPRTSLRPPSARPPSARPGAPRRRDKSIEIILQPNETTKVAGINVKVESFNTELEDDGENLIIIENSNIEEDILGNKHIDQMIIDDEEHQQGHLVQQILETQKELVQGDKSDIEKALKERKNRQTSATQIDSLRGLIQTLTKAVNPTGKLLDFIPEDIDSMQLELTMWRDAYTQAAVELKREKRWVLVNNNYVIIGIFFEI